jgi:RNA polymerase sigma-70 factor (ECF subfamily)
MDKDTLFREAYESYKNAIYRICCCYVWDPEDRKDVFQEVMLRLYKHIGAFQGKSSLKTWIYRIAVNACIDFLRGRKRQERILDRSCKYDLVAAGNPSANGNQVAGVVNIESLYTCIARLPVLDQTLVSLYLEDASAKEMAEVLGISEANVRVKLSRLREALKQMLGENKNGT